MTHPTPIPSPTPECAAFESLLPLLDTDALTPDEATTTRRHLTGCAWCRAQRTGYDTFEAALRRYYGADVSSAMGTPKTPLRLEDIMRADEYKNTDAAEQDDTSSLVIEISSIAPAAPRVFPKRWRPRRFAEIAAVVVVGLLAATLLVNRLGPLGGNQPPLKSPAGAVVFTHSVPWGRLQLNGRTVEVVVDGREPLFLPRGQNTLTYHAPPLPELTCAISAPAAQSDTCPLAQPDPSITGRIGSDGQDLPAYGGRIVDLEAIPDRLSSAQRDALLAAAQRPFQSLSVTVTITPGDHYATPEGRFLTADRTFTTTLWFGVDADSLGPDLMDCAPYCDIPADHWSLAPTINWDYVDQYGKPETVLQGPGGLSSASSELTVRWDGAWRVSLTAGTGSSSLCAIVDDILINRPDSSGLGVGCSGTPMGKDGGILLQVSGADPEKLGYMLYRAGALITLDANARSLVPSLPTASAHELTIARGLGYKG